MKQAVKRIIDLAMIILLPILMAEIIVGQEIHEWLGTAMTVLFLVHHILNFGWWKSFLKGRYSPSRAFGTAIDLLLLFDMLALCVSGIMMSGFVFKFLHISGGMILARQLHLFASYWGLILMSAHLGMHMETLMTSGRKLFHLSEKNIARTWLIRILAVAVSAYGIYAFIGQQIPHYLFLQTHFVIFDETKSTAVYFAETVAIIGLFAATAHYVNKLLKVFKSPQKNAKGYVWKAAAFAIPVLVIALIAVKLNMPAKTVPWQNSTSPNTSNSAKPNQPIVTADDGFVLIKGGSFEMGSPEEEPWRSADETQHTVTVSDFYISPYEVKQSDYSAVMGDDPSNFSGDDLPVENVSWLDAVTYCNALSEKENLTPAYTH